MTTTSPATSRSVRHWTSVLSLWIGFLLLIVEALIGTRFVLKLAGATEGNSFVDFIYTVSDPLVRPFQGIFDEQTVGDDGIFEPEALIALIVYPLIAALLGVLIRNIAASAPAPKADVWGTTARDLYVRMSTLQNSLAASAAVPVTAGGPPRIVDDFDPQIAEMTTSLHQLELNPPNDRAAMAVRGVLDAMNGVRAALRADAAAPAAAGAAGPAAGTPVATTPRSALREQIAALDASLQVFRSAI
jgi:uncharacterized protein YggT (Ycf19 family)